MTKSKGGSIVGMGRVRFKDTSQLKVPGILKKGTQQLKTPPKPPPSKPEKS